MAKQNDVWISQPLQHLSQEVDRLFDELIHQRWGSRRSITPWEPTLDLYETGTAFIIEADLPGVRKQDVSVELEGDTLVLQGRRSVERKTTRGSFYRRERRSGQFIRRLALPSAVQRGEIRAEFRNGVLRVTLPKA